MSERILVGVDGGNTKTIALAATRDGQIVGAARVLGSADQYAVGPAEAIETVARAVDAALREAGVRNFHRATLSLAGADWPEDRVDLLAAARSRWPNAAAIDVVNDAIGALRAAIPVGPGVVIVCGTGLAIGARGEDGLTWHSSFWHEDLGGLALGERGLRAVVNAELGLGRPTTLRDSLLRRERCPDVESLLHRFKSRHAPSPAALSKLAPHILDDAASGDAVAGDLVHEMGVQIGRVVTAGAHRVGIQPPHLDLAIAGGLFRHPSTMLRNAVTAELAASYPRTDVHEPALEPAIGAILLTLDGAGVDVSPGLIEQLRSLSLEQLVNQQQHTSGD